VQGEEGRSGTTENTWLKVMFEIFVALRKSREGITVSGSADFE